MVLASFPAGNPRASLTAAERAAHPDAQVVYDARHDDFQVVASDE